MNDFLLRDECVTRDGPCVDNNINMALHYCYLIFYISSEFLGKR